MSTYLIGDVHGCYDELQALLEKIQFDSATDSLIFVGDLINRGPKSLEVLRLVKSLGSSAQTVLGNHDISLIAYTVGVYHGRRTDFPQIMQASDSDELVEWLRQQPLLIHNKERDFIVTHAGIPPRWSLNKAIIQAQKTEKKLQGNKFRKYLKAAYRSGSDTWKSNFDKYEKFRYRINGFTRLRYCHKNGEPEFKEKCPIGKQPNHLLPWLDCRQQMQDDGQTRLFFGHWAALGYHKTANAICLDSGCVWGDKLTAIKVKNSTIKRFKIVAK